MSSFSGFLTMFSVFDITYVYICSQLSRMLFQQLKWAFVCSVMTSGVFTTLNPSHWPPRKCRGLHLWKILFSCASTVTDVLITQPFPLLYLHIHVKLPIELSGLHKSDLSGPKGTPLASAPWIAPCYSLTSPTGMLMLMNHESHDPGNQ